MVRRVTPEQLRGLYPIMIPIILALLFTSYQLSIISSRPFCIKTTNVSTLFIFGDDTVDAGNTKTYLSNHYCIDCMPHRKWRFTNGRTVADFVAEDYCMELPVASSKYLSGNLISRSCNFAYSFSGILPDEWFNLWHSFIDQVVGFASHIRSYSRFDFDKSIAFISVGTNDLLSSNRPSSLEILKIFSTSLQALMKTGHKNFLISNIAPLGCFPKFRLDSPGRPCNESLNAIAAEYNHHLDMMVDDLKEHKVDIDIRMIDTSAVLQRIMNDPKAFGIGVIDKPCCQLLSGICADSSKVCQDRKSFLFFDGVHLTERGNEIIYLQLKMDGKLAF